MKDSIVTTHFRNNTFHLEIPSTNTPNPNHGVPVHELAYADTRPSYSFSIRLSRSSDSLLVPGHLDVMSPTGLTLIYGDHVTEVTFTNSTSPSDDF